LDFHESLSFADSQKRLSRQAAGANKLIHGQGLGENTPCLRRRGLLYLSIIYALRLNVKICGISVPSQQSLRTEIRKLIPRVVHAMQAPQNLIAS
jgi:hypothetical protein